LRITQSSSQETRGRGKMGVENILEQDRAISRKSREKIDRKFMEVLERVKENFQILEFSNSREIRVRERR